MKYIVSYTHPHSHYIDIEFIINDVNENEILVQLPAWRPGRYELGNFAKNVQKWNAYNQEGTPLAFEKVTKDSWKVYTKDTEQVHIKYNYFANEINAGSSYLDDKQLYVNGVNCFLYLPNRMNEPCELELILPKDYQVASGLKEIGKHQFQTNNFDELVDCPFIASNSLQHLTFDESSVKFHLWFQGECKPDWKKLESDFRKFCQAQIQTMGDFPVKEYHFLFQILTYKAYHGVEHSNSTVISLGPSYDVMNDNGWYKELLGVSSHELYHTWNVKQIRPIEMYPYDYSKENYTVMGYLDEGVTTYYGDLFLLRSGVFDWEQYVKTFNQLLTRHYNNFGTHNLSVAQSSFDTWLDGYVQGIPNRKGSIYVEGALCAFMTDVFIMQNTNNKKSLNDVMVVLYNEYAKKGKGVSDADYKKVIKEVAGTSFDSIYTNYIHGTEDYTSLLQQSLSYLGCNLIITPNSKYNETYLGFKTRYENNKCLVASIYPNSVADKKGLSLNDEIMAINNIQVANDVDRWCNYFDTEEITLTIKRELGKLETISLLKGKEIYYQTYSISKKETPSDNEKMNFKSWSSNKI